jgi:hypothetical protein
VALGHSLLKSQTISQGSDWPLAPNGYALMNGPTPRVQRPSEYQSPKANREVLECIFHHRTRLTTPAILTLDLIGGATLTNSVPGRFNAPTSSTIGPTVRV